MFELKLLELSVKIVPFFVLYNIIYGVNYVDLPYDFK